MTRSRPPHHDDNPAAGDAAHNGPETEIVAIAFGDGRGGGPTGAEDNLDRHQRGLLLALTHLHHSLHGPQTLLEAAGNFSRPPFPPPQRDDTIDTSGART
jgi:hypothetical protein